MRLRGFVDSAAGIIVLPIVVLGLYLLVQISYDSIAELEQLVLVLRGI